MKHLLITTVSLCFVVLLLFSAAQSRAEDSTPAPTSTTTPAPTSTPSAPLALEFIEYGATDADALTFSIRSDGSAVLAQTHKADDQIQVLWQQPGQITPDQLDAINALLQPLNTVTDQHNPAKDYAFIVPISAREALQVLFTRKAQASDAAQTAVLQKVADKLLEIRQPFETLVIFEWSGGFVGRASVLTLRNDGTAVLEDKRRRTTTGWQLTQADLDALRALLQSAPFAQYEPSRNASCADCFLYTITAMSNNGLRQIPLNDADLDGSRGAVPVEIKQLIQALRKISSPS